MNIKGVWNDVMLRNWARKHMTPYDPSMIESASVDLRLSNSVRTENPYWIAKTAWLKQQCIKAPHDKCVELIEAELQANPRWLAPVEFENHILWPGEMVLLSSLEVMEILPYMKGELVLKSTPARKQLDHSHSRHGDPGFGYGEASSWTFEVQNIGHAPYVLKAGESIMQMVVYTMAAEPTVHYGEKDQNYNGQILPQVVRMPLTMLHAE